MTESKSTRKKKKLNTTNSVVDEEDSDTDSNNANYTRIHSILFPAAISFMSLSFMSFVIFVFYYLSHRNSADVHDLTMKQQYEKLIQNEAEKNNELSVYLVTWNVNRKNPSEQISNLFDFDSGQLYDIYAISLQEIPLLSVILPNYWDKEFFNIFNQRGYVELKRIRSMMTELIIYVRRTHLTKYYNIETSSEAVDSFYSKGAVSIRLLIGNIKVCFVGSHLTAHDENYSTRITNYHQIINGIHFGSVDTILNQDIVFWFGDLNFRINELKSKWIAQYVESVKHEKNQSRFEPLLKYDQLNYARANRHAFHEFQEMPLDFAPTYKFKINTQEYVYEHRKPAYTDRILHRNKLYQDLLAHVEDKNLIDMKMIYYDSLPQFTQSDHKPVRSLAYIPLFEMAKAKSRLLMKRVRRDLKSGRSMGIDEDQMTMESGEEELSNDDLNSFTSERLRVQFFPISNWTTNTPFEAQFNIVDSRNNVHSVNSSLVNQFLSSWDWIGLYRENFASVDDYVTYTYPGMGRVVEEGEEALLLFQDETQDQDNRSNSDSNEIIHDDRHKEVTREQFKNSSLSSSLSNYSSVSATTATTTITKTEEEVDNANFENRFELNDLEKISNILKDTSINTDSGKQKSPSSLLLSSSSPSTSDSIKPASTEAEHGDHSPVTVNSPITVPSNIVRSKSRESLVRKPCSKSSSSSCSLSSSSSSSSTSLLTSTCITTNTTATTTSDSLFTVQFDENCIYQSGRYVLLYVRNNGDVIGMSEPFQIIDLDQNLSSSTQLDID